MSKDLIVAFAGLFGVWALTASWGWLFMEVTMESVNNRIDFNFLQEVERAKQVSKTDIWKGR